MCRVMGAQYAMVCEESLLNCATCANRAYLALHSALPKYVLSKLELFIGAAHSWSCSSATMRAENGVGADGSATTATAVEEEKTTSVLLSAVSAEDIGEEAEYADIRDDIECECEAFGTL